VAALMIGEHSLWNGRPNNLSPEDVERVMEKSATDIVGTPQWNPHYAVGYDGWNGWGRLNAGEAVRQVAAPYRVYHSGEPDGTMVAAMPPETYVFNEYETSETWGLPPGPYEIQRYVVEHYYTVDFGPGTTILHSQQNPGFWGRPSSTVGLHNPQGQMDASWLYQISGSTIEVTAYTYCYKVGSLPGQPPLTRWIPEPPNNLKTPWSLHILKSPTVAVPENMQQATLRAHPNPATDQLHLQWTDFAPTHIEVIDQLGKVCLREPAAPARNGNHTIGTAHLAPGLYTVRLSAAGERRTQRFIKH
ncbi:MAG: T9SS type A sorting domain-containing protein, partial [Flavobacteriales bacterium]|nr:T9SS type A sorting domain-containing protein [Flavobacteriales bacterium]